MTACLHLQGGCNSMPGGPGRLPPPLGACILDGRPGTNGGRASMLATLSHRQPGLDMASQLQEKKYVKNSLHSFACPRPLGA